MDEIRTVDLDKYDYRLILNALNEFRSSKLNEDIDVQIIDELMMKLLNTPVNKKEKGKIYYYER